jgi:hypothetical protein
MQFQQCNCFHVDGGVIVVLLWNAAAFLTAQARRMSLGCEGQRFDKGGLGANYLLSHHNNSTKYPAVTAAFDAVFGVVLTMSAAYTSATCLTGVLPHSVHLIHGRASHL